MANNIFIILYSLSAMLTIGILFVSIPNSVKEKTIYFTCFLIHLFIYNAGAIIELTALDMNQAKVGNIVQYFGFPFFSPMIYLFAREYIKKPIRNYYKIGGLFIIPITSFIMVITQNFNNLYYSNLYLVYEGGIPSLVVEGSIYRTIVFLYIYLIYLVAFFSVFKAFYKGNVITRKKIKFLLISIAATVMAGLTYTLNLVPYRIDLIPVLMLIICCYIGYNIYVKNMFLSIPYARDKVLREMRDGYILFDSDDNFMDANKVAISIFPSLANAKDGENLFQFIKIPEVQILKDKKIEAIEISLTDKNNIKKDYRITVSKISKKNDLKVYSWLIYDISELKNIMGDLEYMAKFDPLTGIYNRSAFFSKGIIAFNNTKESNMCTALIMLDVDYFKKVNDTYGHICGDKILIEISERLKKSIRKKDIIARYGGEEFVILIQHIDAITARTIGEKLRKSIGGKKFTFKDKEFDVTISIGMTLYDGENYKNMEEALSVADKLLYEAKRFGRNKVVIG